MGLRRVIRWALFFAAGFAFIYFVFVDSDSIAALVMFFLAGGGWYGFVRRKMTALDSPRHR